MAEALGVAANVIAVVDLFVKVGVLCSIYCTNVKKAPHDIRSLLNEADRISATLKDVERLLTGPNGAKIAASENIRCGITDCRAQLSDLATKLEAGTIWNKMAWPLKKGEVTEIINNLERCRTNISLDLQVYQTALLLDIHQEIVLGKLRTAKGATFDARAEADNAKCYPGTRVDVLQRIVSWGTADDGECIFWLNGMAGTGKSTISRTVAQAFADNCMLGASFFFKRGEGDRGRAAFFFTTIAAQLVRRLPSIAPFVRAEIEADPAINEKSAKDQFHQLIAGPIKKLRGYFQQPSMVIVVDALDECDNVDHIRLIIQLLSQAKAFISVRLRFFVTSRPELLIRLGFKDISGKYEDLVLHQIPKHIIKHDINAFLQHELAIIRQDFNKSVIPNRQLPADWPGTECVQKLVDMALPLFIFAATVCRFIQDRRVGGPKEQLARVLEYQSSSRSNLDASYLPVLHQLLGNLNEPETREVAARFKQIVGSIVVLASPLSKPALARLLGISLDVIEDQLDLLHSVLSVPSDPNTPVQLLHLSFHDFLIDPAKARKQDQYPFWVDERLKHEQLALQCLHLLSTDDTLKRDVCGLRLPGRPRSEIDQKVINARIQPEVQYACQYWVYHWKESGTKIRDGDPVDRFLTCHLLHWFEALSLLGRVQESIGMVDNLLSSLDPINSSYISPFIRDARRVIQTYCSVVDVSPLQIYHSAIVFAPERSIARVTFREQFPTYLSTLPQVDLDWSTYLETLEGDTHDVNAAAFSHDSTLLASASGDHTVKIWDTTTGTCAATLTGHTAGVRWAIFSHDSTMLASASGDHTVKLWDIASGTCISTLRGHSNYVVSVAFSQNSTILASASWDRTVKLWDVAKGACTATLADHSNHVASVNFSHDLTMLASASWDHTIKLWDVVTKSCKATFTGHNNGVVSAMFSHDSMTLVSASWDHTIKLWNVGTGTCTVTLTGHDAGVRSVAFSHDSTMIASASGDHTIKLWDSATGTCTATIKGHEDGVRSAMISHDSTRLVSASWDQTVKVWDIITGDCTATFTGHNTSVRLVVFSNDSKILASVSGHHTVKFWNVITGNCTATLEGHCGFISSITFSHHSQKFASASWDHTIMLWDVASGTCTATLKIGTIIHHLAFDITDSYLCTDIGTFGLNSSLPLPTEPSTAAALAAVPTTASLPVMATPVASPLTQAIDSQGAGVSADRMWVTWNSHRILWLPPAYRPGAWAAKELTLAIGCPSGRVVFVEFSSHTSLM
ncbi:uncharacterized protein N7506_005538 [Penicillium brevicompactum]|uniref:uncharacterized protein n=1 Tax=Penicillium brevicompactum TaxID=5074 RepID=UPI0025414349|nr:uncharacterized protein N7506_005538 [Penicillium brevicompactum]KAJ5337516.1 hypothetical protein N7506_005538 [Penicillium brevicompactum]